MTGMEAYYAARLGPIMLRMLAILARCGLLDTHIALTYQTGATDAKPAG